MLSRGDSSSSHSKVLSTLQYPHQQIHLNSHPHSALTGKSTLAVLPPAYSPKLSPSQYSHWETHPPLTSKILSTLVCFYKKTGPKSSPPGSACSDWRTKKQSHKRLRNDGRTRGRPLQTELTGKTHVVDRDTNSGPSSLFKALADHPTSVTSLSYWSSLLHSLPLSVETRVYAWGPVTCQLALTARRAGEFLGQQ